MLRGRSAYEFKDTGLQWLDPDARVYEVIEQVFELPLWSIRALPTVAESGGGDPQVRFFKRFLTTSTQALIDIVAGSDWDEIAVHGLLPPYMTPLSQQSTSVQCRAIWSARCIDHEAQETWVFDTDGGSYVDPEYGLHLKDVVKTSRIWSATGQNDR